MARKSCRRDSHWRDYVSFFEYFHGDNGAGLEASRRTAWTGVIARAMHLCATTAEQVLEPGKLTSVIEVQEEKRGARPAGVMRGQ